jgi:hypothetical protein
LGIQCILGGFGFGFGTQSPTLFGFHYLEKRGTNMHPAHLWLGLSILMKVMLSSGWLLVEFSIILNFRVT